MSGGKQKFYLSPVAQSIPFEPLRNPGFGGVPSGIESTNVQDAIEEAKQDALTNDRYVVFCSYGGNGNVGRYLEFFPGIDSSKATGIPFYLPIITRLLTVVISATASSNGKIGFYNLNVSSTVPVVEFAYNGTARQAYNALPSSPWYTFPAGALVGVKVTTSAVSKPAVYFFLSAST